RIMIAVDRVEISDRNELDAGIHVPHVLGDGIVLERVMLHLHETKLPWTEHLVAHAPELDSIGRSVAVLRAPPAADCLPGSIAILDPLRGGIGIAETSVHRNHRLRVDLAAEIDELVRSEIIVFNTGPRRVLPW